MNTIEIDSTNCLSELNDHNNVLWWATIEPGLDNNFEETPKETISKIAKLLAAAPVLYSALEDVAQALAWQVHGECRGYSEKLLSVNDALDAAKAALAAAK